jgi:hypothetical protein
MEPKMCFDALQASATPGASHLAPCWRPGKVTSKASALQLNCQFGIGQRVTALQSAPLQYACLATLIAAPRDFFSSTLKAAMPFISSVMRPDLPEVQGLGVFQIGGGCGLRKAACGAVDQGVQLGHGDKL